MKRIGLLAALAFLSVSAAHGQISGVTAELKLDQDQYLPGEDLHLKVRILNRSGQELSFGADNYWFTMSIADPNGLPCAQLGTMPEAGVFSLQSGEMGTRTLNPTPYFDFRKLGEYRITGKVRIEQWNQEIPCKAVTFRVDTGVPLPRLSNLEFGLPQPPGSTNAVPEMRRYSLVEVTSLKQMTLYFQLSDNSGQTLRIFPLTRMVSFSEPEAQIDRSNNLHVLNQTGARTFSYCVIGPDGQWVARQTYRYAGTRPQLRVNQNGQIYVSGGVRLLAADDLPAPDSLKQRQ